MGKLDGLALPGRQYPCRYRDLYETLDKADQAKLAEAMSNPEWSHSGLSKALRKLGIVIADSSIAKHRRGDCSC